MTNVLVKKRMARKNNNNSTFVEITNQAIYDKVIGVDSKMEALAKKLDEQTAGFNEKLLRTADDLSKQIEKNRAEREVEIEKLRGTMNWHQWLLLASVSVACFSVALLFQHLMHP